MASRIQRGGIELRHLLRNGKEMSGHLTNVVVALAVAAWLSDDVPGTVPRWPIWCWRASPPTCCSRSD
ncbi:hypothetical protein [Streptomyces stelliscabiei]|uniref:hypothetical protein n=1 Tax=Streptomyces stelliscabiei TaxID=146820 RepID=UPI002FEEEBF4